MSDSKIKVPNLESIMLIVGSHSPSTRVIMYGTLLEYISKGMETSDPETLLGTALYQRFWNKKASVVWDSILKTYNKEGL